MKKITAVFKVFEDALMEASECEMFEEAVNQEMGWLHDSGILCESWKEQESPDTDLNKYREYFGDIVFPDPSGEGQSEVRRNIYANPAGWAYSFDGLRWKTAPMDIGKIDYAKAMFRKIPADVCIGVTENVRKEPKKYSFSLDNGRTWKPLYDHHDQTAHQWVYHGAHEWIWFRPSR